MKIRRIGFLSMLLAVMVVFLSGCATLPGQPSLAEQQAQAQQIADSVAQARATVVAAQAELAAVKAQVVAASQPVVVTPATDTQPATTVPAPKVVIDAAHSVTAAVETATQQLAKAQGIADALNAAAVKYQADLATAKTQQDQQAAALAATIQAAQGVATVAAPQYSPFIALGGALITGLLGALAVHKANQATNLAITTPGTTPEPPIAAKG